jgi:arylsulfatase A-like enzyme
VVLSFAELRLAKLMAFALAAGALCAACQRQPAHNLVLICIDTVRYDAFMEAQIPDGLDRWLERAQVYGNAVATGPWTIPSVASALTGHYPVQHGAGQFQRSVANLNTDPPSPLNADAMTLAEVLSRGGLSTAAFVSHPFFVTGLGLEQGFESVEVAKRWSHDVDNFMAWRQGIPKQGRYFAYLHFMEAHDAHKRSTRQLADRLAELAPAVRRDVRERASPQACRDESKRQCLQHQVYNAAVLDLRSNIASVLETLEQSGDLDRTVVIVYSDHGEEFWEHRSEQSRLAEDPRGNYGFGHGQSLYRELLHVPLLAWIPKVSGARHQQLVSLVDVWPSALEWLGFEKEAQQTYGQTLPEPTWWRPRDSQDRVVYASGIAYGPQKIAARKNAWKSVYTIESERFEHYDLTADPEERQPLTERPDLQMVFDTLVGDYLDMKRTSAVAATRFDSRHIEALKAIGYLQGYEAKSAPQADASSIPAEDADASTPEDQL